MSETKSGPTPLFKGIVAVVFFGGLLVAGWRYFPTSWSEKLFPSAPLKASTVPQSNGTLPVYNPQAVAPSAVSSAVLPGQGAGCDDAAHPAFTVDHWAWNTHGGAILAVGGPQSTRGSMACARGVNLIWKRQDNPADMRTDMVAFATEVARGNPHPKSGSAFSIVMGDGSPAFVGPLNEALAKLGMKAKVIGSIGFSRGEDKFMALPAVLNDPKNARGMLIAGVLGDGDWCLAQFYAEMNKICNNPDTKTYNPHCLNWLATDGYIDAANKYILGKEPSVGVCETRDVVDFDDPAAAERDGGGKVHRTGERREVCVTGVVTWTPGDVNIATQKGGLVSIFSTEQNKGEMPAVIVGIDKWMEANRPTVEGMLDAFLAGGEHFNSDPLAFKRAMELANVVFHEAGTDAQYWATNFFAHDVVDKTGLRVRVGGSSVSGYLDAAYTFGLNPVDRTNLFAATYEHFGKIVQTQHPDFVSSYPSASEVMDLSYLKNVLARAKSTQVAAAPADTPKFEPGARITQVVARKPVYIYFATNKAEPTARGVAQLDDLLNQIALGGGLAVQVDGYTDDRGKPEMNQRLSEARAFVVKKYLMDHAPMNFPVGRVTSAGYGSSNPVCVDLTESCRAQNRRVMITLGTTNRN